MLRLKSEALCLPRPAAAHAPLAQIAAPLGSCTTGPVRGADLTAQTRAAFESPRAARALLREAVNNR